MSPLTLGTMMFGSWGNADPSECTKIVNRAIDAGINIVDTADFYSGGEAERILGQAIAQRRHEVLVATKVFRPMSEAPNDRGGSRRWIIQACEDSLRRLGTDRLDVYQVHRRDESCDLDETLGALTDLVRQGKVRTIGTSTFPASYIVEAQWVADRRCLERPRLEQAPYSILARGIEWDVLPTCARYGLGVITWSPLNGGWLSGRYQSAASRVVARRADRMPERYDPTHPANATKLAVCEQLRELAREAGLTLLELAIAWTVRHPAVSSVVIGPRTPDQLEDYLAAVDIALDADLLDAIDQLVPPGTNVQTIDSGYRNPGLVTEFRRGPLPLWSFPNGVPR